MARDTLKKCPISKSCSCVLWAANEGYDKMFLDVLKAFITRMCFVDLPRRYL